MLRSDKRDFKEFIQGITEDMIEGSKKSIYYGCPLTNFS